MEGTAGLDRRDRCQPTNTLWGDVWRKLKQDNQFRVAAVMIAIFVGMAIAPQLFFTKILDPQCLQPRGLRTQTPSREHWFGTDILGCDYYTRVIYGARTSMEVGLIVAGLTMVLALTLGGAAGYLRRRDRHDHLADRRHLLLGPDVARLDPACSSLFNGGGVARRRPCARVLRVARHDEARPIDRDQRETPRLCARGGDDGILGRRDAPTPRVAERHRAGARLHGLRRRRCGRRRGGPDLPRGRPRLPAISWGLQIAVARHAVPRGAVPACSSRRCSSVC